METNCKKIRAPTLSLREFRGVSDYFFVARISAILSRYAIDQEQVVIIF